MQELGILADRPPAKVRTTNSQHDFRRYPNRVKDVTVIRPDQIWVADITYIKLRQDFVYLAVLMAVFTRSIRGWQLSRNLDSELTLTALQRALQQHHPHIHHSDQGVQYAAHAYVALLRSHHSLISMAALGEPTENGYAERLMRTIKEEHGDLTEYSDFADAYAQIGHFLDAVYQVKRIHSALGYLTPIEFEQQWRQQQDQMLRTTVQF
jgi:transposase InsO family protein